MSASFPTTLHRDAALITRDYFLQLPATDTVLVVNSCARGVATAESDLDFAILAKPGITATEIKQMENEWQSFSEAQPVLVKYKRSNPFANLHLDVISGIYTAGIIANGEPVDNFEIEIGNQICYAVPMHVPGNYFTALQQQWLPYYKETLRIERFKKLKAACYYDIEHIASFTKRTLYFQAFDILYKCFQKYLQALFIANKTYPIAYNKWIKVQVANLLQRPDIYAILPFILSVNNIESNEIMDKSAVLKELLDDLQVD